MRLDKGTAIWGSPSHVATAGNPAQAPSVAWQAHSGCLITEAGTAALLVIAVWPVLKRQSWFSTFKGFPELLSRARTPPWGTPSPLSRPRFLIGHIAIIKTITVQGAKSGEHKSGHFRELDK